MQSTSFYESDILLKIPIQVAPYDNIVFVSNGNDNYSYKLSVKQVNNMRIWITDENNNPLILPFDWSLTVKLEFSQEADETLQESVSKIENYVKYLALSIQN
jgi:hypothetical protein